MKPRTKARSIALQVLYEVDITGHSPAVALEQRLSEDSALDISLVAVSYTHLTLPTIYSV